MGLSTWFLNFRNTKIQYTLMFFLKKQVFRKIRYTLEVLKKKQFFPIFWKKNWRPYFFKIIINLVPIISWCWNSHSNYEILCFIFEKQKQKMENVNLFPPFSCKFYVFNWWFIYRHKTKSFKERSDKFLKKIRKKWSFFFSSKT